jgi:hypothetical protein
MQVSVGKLDSLNIAAGLFHWKGANKIIRQLSHELTIGETTPNQAVKKLDTLYSNSKYSELDLGQALQLLAVQTSVEQPADSSTKDAPAK